MGFGVSCLGLVVEGFSGLGARVGTTPVPRGDIGDPFFVVKEMSPQSAPLRQDESVHIVCCLKNLLYCKVYRYILCKTATDLHIRPLYHARSFDA